MPAICTIHRYLNTQTIILNCWTLKSIIETSSNTLRSRRAEQPSSFKIHMNYDNCILDITLSRTNRALFNKYINYNTPLPLYRPTSSMSRTVICWVNDTHYLHIHFVGNKIWHMTECRARETEPMCDVWCVFE